MTFYPLGPSARWCVSFPGYGHSPVSLTQAAEWVSISCSRATGGLSLWRDLGRPHLEMLRTLTSSVDLWILRLCQKLISSAVQPRTNLGFKVSSIASKHSYRFGYLKSEHWKNLRIYRLKKDKGMCQVCLCDEWGNDVHHIRYQKSLYDTTVGDLRTLCRRCHKLIHDLSKETPWSNNPEHLRQRWLFLKHKAIRRVKRKKTKRIDTDAIKHIFRTARGRLYYGEFGVIKKWEMPWDDRLVEFYLNNGTAISDQDWLSKSQFLNGWTCVWPIGDH